MALYLLATDLASRLTFVATTTRRGSRKIRYHVMPAVGGGLDNPIAPRFVPLAFRRAAKDAVAKDGRPARTPERPILERPISQRCEVSDCVL